jgi:hypothetical protein
MEEVLRWVKFGRRLPPKVGQYCTPIHKRRFFADKLQGMPEPPKGFRVLGIDQQNIHNFFFLPATAKCYKRPMIACAFIIQAFGPGACNTIVKGLIRKYLVATSI